MQILAVDWHPNWRDRYHVDNLDKVLDILEIRDRQRSTVIGINQWPNTGGLGRGRRDHPILDKPLPPLPSTSDGTGILNSSPNNFMPWTPTNSSHTAGASSHMTSPTNTSQASASPTSPSSGTPTSSVVSCLSCSLEFKGSPQDAISNLRRHIRTSRRHDKKAGLKCPMPECANNKTMRSDNLKGHLQNKHRMSDEAERQRYIEIAKRLSAMAVDSSVSRRSRRSSGRDSIPDSVTLVEDGQMAVGGNGRSRRTSMTDSMTLVDEEPMDF